MSQKQVKSGSSGKTENGKMSAAWLRALKASIRKWENIVDGTGTDQKEENCALCAQADKENGFFSECCKGCPIAEKSGHSLCEKTPYAKWIKYQKYAWDTKVFDAKSLKLAKEELAFLRSMLPKEPVCKRNK